ncbi:MAG: hypothetical protein FWG25_01750, partial [Promicromonosporaceae bacterium]|nr:hypothetical protein [Promicromonosporaceae bacterium]
MASRAKRANPQKALAEKVRDREREAQRRLSPERREYLHDREKSFAHVKKLHAQEKATLKAARLAESIIEAANDGALEKRKYFA